MFVDSHCHLNYKGLEGQDAEVVARARFAGVTTLLTINTRLREFDEVKRLAHLYKGVFCTVGVHPHEAGSDHAAVDAIVERTADTRVVGIGESGLDYYYDHSPRAEQQASFRRHIAAARQTGLPIVVHTRDADEDCAAILKEELGQGAFSGVIHCFTAGAAFARTALDLGFYISFSGIITFKNAGDLRAIAAFVPEDRLLIETDAPFLAPAPHRGHTNEPAYVTHVAAALAKLRGMPAERVAELTTANFFRLFSKARVE